ncbi:glycosyltransferase family 4 protein [Halorientalis pallida]|uniref:glycosyltransferase family 4 protein n=1 Tax=Halorientalis pallida TaxID=2479928 RepID=UPI003C6F6058
MPDILIRSHRALRKEGIAGGAERLMQNIGHALAKRGWRVDILCPRPGSEATHTDTPIDFIEFDYTDPTSSVERFLNMFRGTDRCRSALEAGMYDVVLDDVSHYPFYPMHFIKPKQTTNALFMHMAFFGSATEYVGPVKGRVVHAIDRTLPYLNDPEIVCAGEGTESRINTELDYWDTTVLHPCIQIDEYEYEITPNSDSILFLGRLDVQKNVSTLLKAWRLVERSENHPTLKIAGSGPKGSELRRLANNLGLDSVQFLGYVDEAKKIELLRDASLLVLPSKMEGYATTGLESMASGTPVIGSDTYGINEYIEHGETGFLAPVDDHRAFANLILDLTSDPEQIRPVAVSGRELAEAHSFEEFADDAHDVFSSIQ